VIPVFKETERKSAGPLSVFSTFVQKAKAKLGRRGEGDRARKDSPKRESPIMPRRQFAKRRSRIPGGKTSGCREAQSKAPGKRGGERGGGGGSRLNTGKGIFLRGSIWGKKGNKEKENFRRGALLRESKQSPFTSWQETLNAKAS